MYFPISDAVLGSRRSLAYRIICGCILLITVVITNEYPAIYTAQLAVPRYTPLVKSVGDVAAEPDIKVFMTKNSETSAYVLVCYGDRINVPFWLKYICFAFIIFRNRRKGLSKSSATGYAAIRLSCSASITTPKI